MDEIGGAPELWGVGVTVIVTIPGVVFPAGCAGVFFGVGVGLFFGVGDDVVFFGVVDDVVVL